MQLLHDYTVATAVMLVHDTVLDYIIWNVLDG